jgi:hypothetical protein
MASHHANTNAVPPHTIPRRKKIEIPDSPEMRKANCWFPAHVAVQHVVNSMFPLQLMRFVLPFFMSLLTALSIKSRFSSLILFQLFFLSTFFAASCDSFYIFTFSFQLSFYDVAWLSSLLSPVSSLDWQVLILMRLHLYVCTLSLVPFAARNKPSRRCLRVGG